MVLLELVQVLYGFTGNLTSTYTCARNFKFSPDQDESKTRSKPEKILFDSYLYRYFMVQLVTLTWNSGRTYKSNRTRTQTCFNLQIWFWWISIIFFISTKLISLLTGLKNRTCSQKGGGGTDLVCGPNFVLLVRFELDWNLNLNCSNYPCFWLVLPLLLFVNLYLCLRLEIFTRPRLDKV